MVTINKKQIEILDKVDNYEEAIKRSCDILEENGIIDKRYFEAIKAKIQEFGSYFCIADGVCMPHARPEDGALEEGLCILKLNNPVDFDGKAVNVFFTVSAKDGESHLGLIKQIAEICMDNNKLDRVKNAKNKEEILALF